MCGGGKKIFLCVDRERFPQLIARFLRSCRISLTPLLHGVECGHAACCSTHCGIKIWPANAATHNIRHGDDALCVMMCSWLFAQKILSKKVFSVRAIAESSEKFDK